MTTVDAGELARVAAWAARALPVRPAVPVLSAIRVECDGDRMTCSAFDYAVHATASTAAFGYLRPMLVSGTMLTQAAGKLASEGEVTLEEVSTGLKLSAKKARFSFAEYSPEEYPTVPAMPPLVASIPQFAQVLPLVGESASTDDGLPVLQGVQLVAGNGVLEVMATDRYRASVGAIPYTGDDFTCLPSARETIAALKDVTGPVDLHVDMNRVGLAIGGRRISMPMTGGDFPKIKGLLPPETPDQRILCVPTRSIIRAIDTVSMTVDDQKPITLVVEPGGAAVRAGSAARAAGNADIDDVDYDGDAFEAHYNPGWLRSVVSRCIGKWVCLRWSQGINRPVHVSGYDPNDRAADTTVQHILMPVRTTPKES